MAYIRFIVPVIHSDSTVETGLLQVAARLAGLNSVSSGDRASLSDHLRWFSANLNKPSRFNKTSSKGYYRRATKGISWFKDKAHEHIRRMHDIKRIAERNGFSVSIVQETRIGYVVYEDEYQVVAEPFADTVTG